MPYRKLFSMLVCLICLLCSFIDGNCADGKHEARATGKGTSAAGAPPDSSFIQLTANPPIVPIARGGRGNTNISIWRDGDWTSVTLSASELPPGITANLAPTSGLGSVLTLHAASDAVGGSYPIRITGNAPGLTAHVVVTAIVMGEVKLLDNSFETEGEWSYSPPTGTSAQWAVVSSGTMPESYPHSGGSMASFNSYSATPGHQSLYYLKTGFAIPASVSTPTLKFWMFHDTANSNSDTVTPCISTDGKNFAAVEPTVRRYDGSTGWGEVSVDLSGYKGESNVIVGFLGSSAQGNDIYLDDVTVVAEGKTTAGMKATAEPGIVHVVQGTSAWATITTSIYGWYSSTVSLTATNLPPGVTATFEPAIIAAPGGGRATVTFTASDSAALGRYPVTISCAGGGATELATVTLSITPTFSVTVSGGGIVTSKTPATFTVATKGTGGFNSPVALSVYGIPRDATATLAPETIAAPGTGTATLTFTAASTTPYANSWPIKLIAVGGGITRRIDMGLAVHPDETYLLGVSPASLSIGQHGIKKGTVTSTVPEVYKLSADLAVSGLPPDVTGTLDPATIPVPGSGTATITFTAGAAAAPGTYPITVTSTITFTHGGQMTRQAEMNLTVFAAGPPNFYNSESGTVESFSDLYSTFRERADGVAYARNLVVANGPTLERDLSFTLKGGYDSTFTTADGASVIEGPLIIRGGRLTLEHFIVR